MSDILFRAAGPSSPPDAFAEAVLVRDGRIAAVGRESDLVRLAARGHETVDLDGGLLTPGFTDAHIHPVQAGLERAKCDLAEVYGLPAYLERIARLRRPRTRTTSGSTAAAGTCRPSPAACRTARSSTSSTGPST